MPKKKKEKVSETRFELLEQYDGSLEEVIEEKEKQYAFYIGTFLIHFNSLEHSLDVEIANLINDRTHEIGYTVVKNMEFIDKIDLYSNLAKQRLSFSEKRKASKATKFKGIKSKLEDLMELRNKIAHAKWHTLDSDGYVRVDTRPDKDNGWVRFRRFKITPKIMRKGINDADALSEKLGNFTEDLWNTN